MRARAWATAVTLAALTGVQSGSASANPRLPTAYTGEPEAIGQTSVTLKGSVFPNAQPTSYYFQYGPTGGYGAQTPTASAGAGDVTVHVHATLGGLAPGASYHFRLVAFSPAGVADGQDRTVTTHRIPLTFSVSASPAKDLYGTPFSVLGTLSGTGNGARELTLQAEPFPYVGGFRELGPPTLTGPGGEFAFRVGALPENTQLRVTTLGGPFAQSPVMAELVAVRVSLHVRPAGRPGYARLYGSVAPPEPRSVVLLQRLRRHLPARTVASVVVVAGGRHNSRFGASVRVREPGLYRAAVEVASGAQSSNDSRAVLVR